MAARSHSHPSRSGEPHASNIETSHVCQCLSAMGIIVGKSSGTSGTCHMSM